jgi:hypothetical protein
MQVKHVFKWLTVSTVGVAIAPLPTILWTTPTLANSEISTPTPVLAQTITPATSSIENGQYRNDFFGFSMDLPADWAIASQETQDAVMDLGTEILSENNPALGEAAAASLQNTYQLLLVSEESLDNPSLTFNPNLLGMAERVAGISGMVTGEDYLLNHRALVGQTGLPYEAIGDIYPVTVGNGNFYRSDFELGGVLQQAYIFTIDQGYAYGFILSGLPEQMADLESMVESIQFDEQ